MIKKHFNKNLIMFAEEEQRFQLTYHCHITGKYRGAAYWSCNNNLKLSKKFQCNIS